MAPVSGRPDSSILLVRKSEGSNPSVINSRNLFAVFILDVPIDVIKTDLEVYILPSKTYAMRLCAYSTFWVCALEAYGGGVESLPQCPSLFSH